MALSQVESLMALGVKLGFEGAELRDFVSVQQREEREARAAERAVVAAAREDARAERESREREAQAEREAREAQAQRDHELAKLQLQRDIALQQQQSPQPQQLLSPLSANSSDSSASSSGGHYVRSPLPKLPKFDEQKDDIDAFLERFERFATMQGWPETTWSISLSPLLTGKGLLVYSSLSVAEAGVYETLKRSLLRRYEMNEDGFRGNFVTRDPIILSPLTSL